MKKLVSISALLATLALLSGCSSKKPDVPPAPPTPTTDTTTGVDDPNATVGDTDASAGPPGELLSKRVVYFDFDRSDIRADSQSIVAAHAAYLAKNPAQKVRLEGHADERGSREYNIGAPRARTAGCCRDAVVDRELWRRTSRGRGQRRAGLWAQPPRRDRVPEVIPYRGSA
jgi:peptidoglycan-associated lipoprotein